jgi:hypothetical protein
VLGVLIGKETDMMQGGRERTFVTYRLAPESPALARSWPM